MVLSPACTCSSAVWKVGAPVSSTAVPVCVAMILSLPYQHGCPHAFSARDLLGRDVVVALIVEGVSDSDRNQADERQDGKPPNVPDQGEPEHGAAAGKDDARAGVLRHMNRLVALQRSSKAALLHVPPGILIVNDRGKGEVVGRRRRGRRPLQRPPVP